MSNKIQVTLSQEALVAVMAAVRASQLAASARINDLVEQQAAGERDFQSGFELKMQILQRELLDRAIDEIHRGMVKLVPVRL